MNDSSELLILE